MDQNMVGERCGCMHHKMVPMLIVVIGLLFLLRELGIFTGSMVGVLWPIALIIIGFQKLMAGKCKCCPR